MNTLDERRALELLDTMLALPAERREAWLAEQRFDAAMERRLRRFLQLQARSEDVLPTWSGFAAAGPRFPDAGERIGPYRIERPISAGGMGVVYLAQRDDGVYAQQVAIKLVRSLHPLHEDTLGERLYARFDEERAILAQLAHRNIVRILDGGRTEAGIPYLVMEYVDGVNLVEYCRSHALGVNARIRLFVKVCDAVQAAHSHLVVHRDLKPANILVDRDGEPRLLDFGIAKLLDPLRATQADAPTTLAGAMTPAYASPEQVRQQPLTTRTDIYSLGVMLYQLLSGELPYRFDGLSPMQIERVVCELVPPPMSQTLLLPDADAGYAPPPRRFDADLERIVAKALHKDAERRYGSARELADDLNRYLSGEPVKAQRDTLLYRVRKFLTRHRAASIAAGIALAAILAATGVAVAQAVRAQRAADEAAEINRFLIDVLANADPYNTGEEMTLGQALDAAAEMIDSRFGSRPELAAGVRHSVGYSMLNRGRLDAAEPQLLKALEDARASFGENHDTTLQIVEALAQLRVEQGRYGEAVALYGQVIGVLEGSGRTATYSYVIAQNNLGRVYLVQEDYPKARAHVEKSIDADRRRDAPLPLDERANQITNLAHALHGLGELDAADEHYAHAAELLRQVHPEGSPDVAILLNNRAQLARDRQREDEAIALTLESVAMRERVFNGDHPVVLFGLNNLARMAFSYGRIDLARETAEKSAAMAARLPDGGGDSSVVAYATLAQVRLAQGDRAGAEQALQQAQAALAARSETPEWVVALIGQVRSALEE